MSRVFANTQAPVGGGLAARVVVQLTHVLTDAPSSLASQLLQGICGVWQIYRRVSNPPDSI